MVECRECRECQSQVGDGNSGKRVHGRSGERLYVCTSVRLYVCTSLRLYVFTSLRLYVFTRSPTLLLLLTPQCRNGLRPIKSQNALSVHCPGRQGKFEAYGELGTTRQSIGCRNLFTPALQRPVALPILGFVFSFPLFLLPGLCGHRIEDASRPPT